MKSIMIGSLIALSFAMLMLTSSSAYTTCEPDRQVNDTLTGKMTTISGECTISDGSCITGWECQNGVAVKADYVPQALIDNPESAKEAGYHTVDGNLCYANPKAMPDCSGTGGSLVPDAPVVQEVPVQDEVAVQKTFWQKILNFFGID